MHVESPMVTPATRRLRLRAAALALIVSGAAQAAPASQTPTRQAAQAAVAGAGFSLGSCLVTEGPSGLTPCNFVVTLASPASAPLELTYQTGSSENLLGSNTESSLEEPLVGSESAIFGTGALLGAWLVESGNVELKSWMNWQPAHYRQSLDMHGDTAGTIGRDIATQPGQQYIVSFARSGHPVCANAVTTLSAFFGPELLGNFSFDSTGNSTANMGWRYEAVAVTATAATTRLRFASTTPGGCGPALDDLAVSPTGAASSGIDFVPAWRHQDEPLILPAGTTTHTIAVNVIGDTRIEGYEDFALQVCIASLGCETAFGGINDGSPDAVFRNGFEGDNGVGTR
jgi:hypothetical protein